MGHTMSPRIMILPSTPLVFSKWSTVNGTVQPFVLTLKFHTNYLDQTLKDMNLIHRPKFKVLRFNNLQAFLTPAQILASPFQVVNSRQYSIFSTCCRELCAFTNGCHHRIRPGRRPDGWYCGSSEPSTWHCGKYGLLRWSDIWCELWKPTTSVGSPWETTSQQTITSVSDNLY